MADFKYVGQMQGATTGTMTIKLGGAVEAGDFIAPDRTKADADDKELGYFALEAGAQNAYILVMPVLAGMIFEGKADAAVTTAGIQVALAVATADQVVDVAGGTNLFFVALDEVAINKQTRVMYIGAYHLDSVS